MSYCPDNALIIQSDRTVLLDVHAPKAAAAQAAIAPFAELIKSPEHIHTYRLSPLSIWNARAAGMPVAAMVAALQDHAKYPMPESVAQELEALGQRYGLTTLTAGTQGDLQLLTVADRPLAALLQRHEQVGPLLGAALSPTAFAIALGDRGRSQTGVAGGGLPGRRFGRVCDGGCLSPGPVSSPPPAAVSPFTCGPISKPPRTCFTRRGRPRAAAA
jgi:DNA excision repair protein ERCC-3